MAVGNFDGVHRGHAELVRQVRQLAETVGGPATIITFDPHPLQLLAPERFQPQLTTVDDRAMFLLNVGADAVGVLQTDAELLGLTPETFFSRILIDGFQAKGIVEGFNFRFGRNRAGSIDTLRDMCGRQKIPFRIVEPFEWNGVLVSSSRVRGALDAGEVRSAADLMNRRYSVIGLVVEGAKRGRTIGFPTANLDLVQTLLPKEGVYSVQAHTSSGSFPAAANIGPNPTFGEHARKIEVHLIGFDGDLYGSNLRVEFVERLRETRKFANVGDLVEQMKRDIEAASNQETPEFRQ